MNQLLLINMAPYRDFALIFFHFGPESQLSPSFTKDKLCVPYFCFSRCLKATFQRKGSGGGAGPFLFGHLKTRSLPNDIALRKKPNPSLSSCVSPLLSHHYHTHNTFFFFKILFVNNLYTQCWAQNYNPEIKRYTLY